MLSNRPAPHHPCLVRKWVWAASRCTPAAQVNNNSLTKRHGEEREMEILHSIVRHRLYEHDPSSALNRLKDAPHLHVRAELILLASVTQDLLTGVDAAGVLQLTLGVN